MTGLATAEKSITGERRDVSSVPPETAPASATAKPPWPPVTLPRFPGSLKAHWLPWPSWSVTVHPSGGVVPPSSKLWLWPLGQPYPSALHASVSAGTEISQVRLLTPTLTVSLCEK